MSEGPVIQNDEGQVVPQRARDLVKTVLHEGTDPNLFAESGVVLMRQLVSLGESLVPALAEALRNEQGKRQILAAWILLKAAETDSAGKTNPRSVRRAAALIVDALNSGSGDLCLYSCVQLAGGAVPREAVPQLMALVESGQTELPVYAAAALSWCGEVASMAIDHLAPALWQKDATLAVVAATALLRLGVRRAEAVDALVRRLSKTPSSYRYSLILALREAGPVAREATPKLEEIAGDASNKGITRAAAAEALGAVAPGTKSRSVLVELLKDSDAEVILGVIAGLRRCGKVPSAAVTRLRYLLCSADREERRAGALGLQVLGPQAEPVLPALIRSLCEETDQELIGDMARACAGVGAAAAKPLVAVLRQGNIKWTGSVATALVMLKQDAAAAIAESLASGEDLGCWVGVSLLRTLRRDAEPAIPALADLLGRVNDERAMYVISALAACSDVAQAAIPALVTCFLERQGEASELAGRLLLAFGNATERVLTERLSNANEEHRQRIASVLERLRPQTQETFEELLAYNADKSLLLFVFAGRILDRSKPIGLRKVSGQLEKDRDAVRLGIATSEPSLRDMLAELSLLRKAALTQQTTRGSLLSDAGRALLAEAERYLVWRGFLA